MSPSSSLELLSVSFGRFVSFKYSFRFISDSGSSLLLYNSSLQCYSVLSTIAQVMRKMNLKILAS